MILISMCLLLIHSIIHNPEYERLLPLGEAKENNTEKKKLGFLARLRK